MHDRDLSQYRGELYIFRKLILAQLAKKYTAFNGTQGSSITSTAKYIHFTSH